MKLNERFQFVLELVDFRSVKGVFQSALLNFLHKNVTRNNANSHLKTMIENLAARVASLKYLIGNVLQVIWPQLLKEQFDEYININSRILNIVNLLTARFLSVSSSEESDENFFSS
jgi:hypothetical protein